jgi:hypothetical protein
MNSEMSEGLEILMLMHALDSAIGRVLQSINLLAGKDVLSPELVRTSTAFIESIHDHIKLALRKTLGDTNSKSFSQFSNNLSEMESQLIAESLTAEPARSSLERKDELTFANFDKFRQRKTEDA